MNTAGKRIISFGLVVSLMLAYTWQATLAGLFDVDELVLGHCAGYSTGLSWGHSSDSEEPDDKVLGESEAGAKIPLPVAAPVNFLRAGTANIMTSVKMRSIEDSNRDEWFYVTETVSVQINLEHNGPIPQGSTTTIQFPEKLNLVKTSDTITIPNQDDNNRVIGIATIDTVSNSITIVATDGAEKATKVTGYVVLSAEINRAGFQNQNFTDTTNETFEFIENGDKIISVPKVIRARQVTGSYHLLYKSGRHTENGRIQWNTNINYYGSPEMRRDLKNIQIVDEIGEDHKLVSDSVKVAAYTWIFLGPDQLLYHGSPKDITNQCTIVERADGKGFTVTIPDSPQLPSDFNNKAPYPYRVSYQTDITDDFHRTKYENAVTLNAINASDNSIVTRSSNNWVVVEAGSGGSAKPVELTVKKVDAETGEPLSNAVFELRNGSGVTIATLITESNGVAFYEGPLRVNTTYYLYEVQTPGSQYELADRRAIEIKADTTEIEIEIPNKKAERYGILEIQKLDKEGFRLSGATFILFLDEKMALPAKDQYEQTSWTTGQDGQPGFVRIEGLPIGTYYLLETEAPEGYKRDTALRKVEVLDNPSGVSTVTIYNERDEFDLVILKEDADTKERLAGAEFTAYRKAPSGNWTEVDTFIITDKDKGYTRKVIVGEYRLWENKAPDGYSLPNSYIEFKITEADKQYGVYTIIATNERIKGTPTINASVRAYAYEENHDENAIGGAELVLQRHNGTEFETLNGVTTGNTGLSGVIGGLDFGTYRFAAQNDPEGYTAAVDGRIFELTVQNSTRAPMVVPVPYRLETAILEIIKYDMDDNSLLPGAKFSLQSADKSDYFIAQVTGEDGRIVINDIPYGTYNLWEVDAPENYYTSGRSKEIVIDEKHEVIRVPNKKVDPDASADIKLVKYAEGNEDVRLSGADFKLEHLIGDDDWEVYLQGLQTDENGEIHIHNLPLGIYQFVETSAPTGYEIDKGNNSTIIHLDDTSDGISSVSVVNRKISSSGGGNIGGNNTGGSNSGSSSRDRDKGSNVPDTYPDRNAGIDLQAGGSTDPIDFIQVDSDRPGPVQEDTQNPWTGAYTVRPLLGFLSIAVFFIFLGGALLLGFRKEE